MAYFCPRCGHRFDRESQVTLKPKPARRQQHRARKRKVDPKPDDVTLCIACAAICRYNKDMTLRLAEGGELIALQLSEHWHLIAEVRNRILEMH
ncbi:MAG TPA: hypothetical protein VGC20_13330 [bacterium]